LGEDAEDLVNDLDAAFRKLEKRRKADWFVKLKGREKIVFKSMKFIKTLLNLSGMRSVCSFKHITVSNLLPKNLSFTCCMRKVYLFIPFWAHRHHWNSLRSFVIYSLFILKTHSMSTQHLKLFSSMRPANWSDNKSEAVPIYQTTSYGFDNSEHAANLFGLGLEIFIQDHDWPQMCLNREWLPSKEVSRRLPCPGQAAQFLALDNILHKFLTTSYLYGGTCNQFKVSFKRLGIEVRFAERRWCRRFC
jgi:hypothetical protein